MRTVLHLFGFVALLVSYGASLFPLLLAQQAENEEISNAKTLVNIMSNNRALDLEPVYLRKLRSGNLRIKPTARFVRTNDAQNEDAPTAAPSYESNSGQTTFQFDDAAPSIDDEEDDTHTDDHHTTGCQGVICNTTSTDGQENLKNSTAESDLSKDKTSIVSSGSAIIENIVYASVFGGVLFVGVYMTFLVARKWNHHIGDNAIVNPTKTNSLLGGRGHFIDDGNNGLDGISVLDDESSARGSDLESEYNLNHNDYEGESAPAHSINNITFNERQSFWRSNNYIPAYHKQINYENDCSTNGDSSRDQELHYSDHSGSSDIQEDPEDPDSFIDSCIDADATEPYSESWEGSLGCSDGEQEKSKAVNRYSGSEVLSVGRRAGTRDIICTNQNYSNNYSITSTDESVSENLMESIKNRSNSGFTSLFSNKNR